MTAALAVAVVVASIPPMRTVHVTKRAIEFLQNNMMPEGGYTTPMGQAACGADHKGLTAQDWCKTEDARSMVHGLQTTFEWNGKGRPRLERPVRAPTCEFCQVILDKALAACPEDQYTPLVRAFVAIFMWDYEGDGHTRFDGLFRDEVEETVVFCLTQA